MRYETKFIQTIPLDPVVAFLLGRSQGNVVAHGISIIPTYSGRLSRSIHNGVLYIGGGRTVTPGNGLFLTSTVSNVLAGYTYTGLRRWSFSLTLNGDLAKSVGNVIGNYGDYGGTLTSSRQISGALHALVAFYARKYESPSFQGYNRPFYGVRLGIGFSPGDVPLRLW